MVPLVNERIRATLPYQKLIGECWDLGERHSTSHYSPLPSPNSPYAEFRNESPYGRSTEYRY